MAVPTYGYPLILEFSNIYLEKALTYAIRDQMIPPHDLTVGNWNAKDLIPRLDNLSLTSQPNGDVEIRASYSVASGTLRKSNSRVTGFKLKGVLSAEISGKSLIIKVGQKKASILNKKSRWSSVGEALSKQALTDLGYDASINVSLDDFKIIGYDIDPKAVKNVPIRGIGKRVAFGVSADLRNPNSVRSLPDSPTAFENYKSNLANAIDWGYRVDRSLINTDVLLRACLIIQSLNP